MKYVIRTMNASRYGNVSFILKNMLHKSHIFNAVERCVRCRRKSCCECEIRSTAVTPHETLYDFNNYMLKIKKII